MPQLHKTHNTHTGRPFGGYQLCLKCGLAYLLSRETARVMRPMNRSNNRDADL